jgi:hypothetical protein
MVTLMFRIGVHMGNVGLRMYYRKAGDNIWLGAQ